MTTPDNLGNRQKQSETDRQRQTDRDRQTETDRQRQTDRDRQTETDRQRQTDRDRQTETDRQRQTDRDRQRELMVSWLEVFLMILFLASLADAATRRSKSSPNAKLEVGS